jgi:head-tail adaptor
MGLIATGAPIATRHKRIAVFVLGDPIPDGDGGFTRPKLPLDPPVVSGHVRPASARSLEQITSGTVLAQAEHQVTIPYHPQITVDAVLEVEHYPHPPRTLSVIFVGNPDERNGTLELVCTEIVA